KTVFGSEPSKLATSLVPCHYVKFIILKLPNKILFSISAYHLSVVGLGEEQAIEQANGDILVYTSTFNPINNSISGRQEKTLMKLIVSTETNKVIGASTCWPDAAEIMQ
ncbi:hypothetical protein M8C21_032130, partial [Ambrosia artemisiifolia]